VNKAKKPWLYAVLICVVWLGSCNVILEFFGIAPDEDGKEKPESPDSSTPDNPATLRDPLISFFVSENGKDSNDGMTDQNPFLTLTKAYTQALGDPTRNQVVLLTNITVQDKITLGESTQQTRTKTIKIIGGPGITITRNGGSNDSVMEVRGGEKVEFRSIKIDGKRSDTNYHRALSISGSGTEVTLEDGTEITGKSVGQGAGILVSNSAKLVMNAGSAVSESAVVTTNVNGASAGGGVAVVSGGTFEMIGGKISGNKAYDGGGVFVMDSSSRFKMSGGEISGNTSTYNGGGIHVRESGRFEMIGGIIYGANETIESKRNISSKSNSAAFYKFLSVAIPSGLDATNKTIRAGVIDP
jgi:hypothetical protein